MTKDSLIKGTIILTLAAFTARFLGLIQRVPLKHLLGDSGMASYGISYNLYHVVLIIATAGIPSALSKLISEKTALNEHAEAMRIYRAALWFAVTIGVVATAVVWLAAPYYAVNISRDADAILAIRALAPALLFFPLIAMMRGYFLGRQNMTAGAVSQIFEQILRVVTAVALAYFILRLGYELEWAVAGASFGGVMGGIAALGVMLYYWRRLKARDRTELANQSESVATAATSEASTSSFKHIYMTIFKVSIPISFIAITVPLVYLIDSSTVIALLENKLGYDHAKEALGLLTGRAQSLAGIPPILAIAISQSIVPIVSAAYAKANMTQVNEQASLAFRISFVACLPIILFLCVAARPINTLLFGDTNGTTIIVALVIGTAVHVLMMISGAILIGIGQINAQVRYVFVGIAVKLGGGYLLAPLFGIYGIIAATALCFGVIMYLNLRLLRKAVTLTILGKKWVPLGLTAVIVSMLSLGVELVLFRYVQTPVPFITYSLHALLIGLLVVATYVLLLIKLKVIVADDVHRLPARLQRLVKPVFHRLG